VKPLLPSAKTVRVSQQDINLGLPCFCAGCAAMPLGMLPMPPAVAPPVLRHPLRRVPWLERGRSEIVVFRDGASCRKGINRRMATRGVGKATTVFLSQQSGRKATVDIKYSPYHRQRSRPSFDVIHVSFLMHSWSWSRAGAVKLSQKN
jgi:hypothetical protein